MKDESIGHDIYLPISLTMIYQKNGRWLHGRQLLADDANGDVINIK